MTALAGLLRLVAGPRGAVDPGAAHGRAAPTATRRAGTRPVDLQVQGRPGADHATRIAGARLPTDPLPPPAGRDGAATPHGVAMQARPQCTAPAARRGLVRSRGVGVLPVIAGLFLASALLRLGDGIGGAVADGMPLPTAMAPPTVTAPVDGALLADTLAALARREGVVTAREGALADRMQALELAERRLEGRLAALAVAEGRLAELVALADRASERDIDHLTAVYQSMKPKEAAALFAEMDPPFAAGFLARMPPEAAATILSGIDPRTAYALSAILAGRNAGAPLD